MTRKITKIISFMKSFYPFIFILLFTVPVYGQDMPIGRKVAVEAFVLDSLHLPLSARYKSPFVTVIRRL